MLESQIFVPIQTMCYPNTVGCLKLNQGNISLPLGMMLKTNHIQMKALISINLIKAAPTPAIALQLPRDPISCRLDLPIKRGMP
ncbi:uncharacterized protein MELLADRAFT_90862 [Melampsora larici-populina 98AG31]|uniref:Uncharacterized protein n=1 Tax=Melampsora larici-populina (strain 98AG31 / pathotype 3-4-7) TaxID=747676 RepID=F4R7S3_MELLP|nr:uncharacterized protein MELLADRAFT_90862 [Melampsora larici-populina 98AG31]EGG11364.1 hypothetical protein MELLADRAFT_90862 [Melampsora larici-populina 98AG31]